MDFMDNKYLVNSQVTFHVHSTFSLRSKQIKLYGICPILDIRFVKLNSTQPHACFANV